MVIRAEIHKQNTQLRAQKKKKKIKHWLNRSSYLAAVSSIPKLGNVKSHAYFENKHHRGKFARRANREQFGLKIKAFIQNRKLKDTKGEIS